ncbi:tetratricopeptide repeat protein [Xanthobacter sediminis]
MSPSHEQVWNALERIEASEQFRQSERLRHFLRYIVKETIEGRSDRIKSYTINLEVFGRDSAEDAIVRTTANRLRDALEKYYNTGGRDEPVRIALPKGRYVPAFSLEPGATSVPAVEAGVSGHRPGRSNMALVLGVVAVLFALVVASGFTYQRWGALAVEPDNGRELYILVVRAPCTVRDPCGTGTTASFSNELISQLVRIGTARIVGPIVSDDDGSAVAKQIGLIGPNTALVLSFSLKEGDRGPSVIWRLSDARSHSVLWTGESSADGSNGADIAAMAGAVAFRVLGTNGALSALAERSEKLSDDGYKCIPQAQRLAAIFHDTSRAEVRQCLEAAVAADPGQAAYWSLLAQQYSYMGEGEPSFGRESESWKRKARDAAVRAFDLTPASFLAQQAQLYVAFSDGHQALFNQIADRMLARYPGDPHLKIRIGSRLIRLGQYEKGRRLLETGISEKDGAHPGDYIPLALADIGEGSYDKAIETLKLAKPLKMYLVPLLNAVALAETGRLPEASLQIGELLKLRPNYQDYAHADAAAYGLTPELGDRLIDGLRKAGLSIPQQPATTAGP